MNPYPEKICRLVREFITNLAVTNKKDKDKKQMIRKIAGDNIVRQTEVVQVHEMKPDQSKAENEQQLNQYINLPEQQKFNPATAAEKKFTASITETVLRSTLENQLQSNSQQTPGSGGSDVIDMFSDMQQAYKKQQEERQDAAKLRAAVQTEPYSTGNVETVKEHSNVDVPESETTESQPSMPINPGQQAADIFSGMEEAYKKQQAEQKEAAKLRTAIVNQDHPDV
jgi:hypothetical protein